MRVFVSYRRDDTAGAPPAVSVMVCRRLPRRRQRVPGRRQHRPGCGLRGRDPRRARRRRTRPSSSSDPNGRRSRRRTRSRELREQGDYVRQEVAGALASGQPVVPVLVGGARLPAPDELPDELAPLLKRQAITLRDEHVERGRRRPRAPAPSGDRATEGSTASGLAAGPRWRRWSCSAGSRRGSGPPATAPARARATARCRRARLRTTRGRRYRSQPNRRSPTSCPTAPNRVIRYAGTAVRAKRRPSDWRILVDVDVANATAPVEGTTEDEWYVVADDFNHVVVDELASGEVPSASTSWRERVQVPPGQRAVVRLGFDTSRPNPTRAELLLETGGPPIPLVPSPT